MAIIMIFKSIADPKNLEYILNNLKEGILAHDMDRKILFFNDAAENITGVNRKDVLGRDCHEAFGEPFCGQHCSFCNNIPPDIDKREHTINMTTPSGQNRVIEMSVIMMKDEN